MVRANKRNEALRIESALFNKIAMLELRRQRKLWELISRRSAGGRGLIPKFSMLLAVLEWGVA